MFVRDALFGTGNTIGAAQTHSRISLIHFVFPMTFVIIAIVGCTTIQSGEAPTPVSSVPLLPSAAGLAALSNCPGFADRNGIALAIDL